MSNDGLTKEQARTIRGVYHGYGFELKVLTPGGQYPDSGCYNMNSSYLILTVG
jgi:hypothetical protein